MRRVGIWLFCALLLVPGPAWAGVSVSFDLEVLNELLPAMAAQEVQVPIAGGRSLRVEIEDLRIRALAPGSGGTPDRILTSMRLKVPSLGLDMALEPSMSLTAVESEGTSWLELGFEEIDIPLPLGASVNAAPFLKPVRFPAEELYLVAGAHGDIWVRSKLTEIRMGTREVKFELDLGVVDAGGQE